MKTIYLSCVFVFIIQICNAQLGYFGKKHIVKFDGYFIPAIRAKDINSEDQFAGLATTANFNVSRIISNRHVLSLEYNYLKDYMSSRGDYGLRLVRYVRQNGVGVGVKRFRKSWIAPIGSYWKYVVMVNKNDVSEQKEFYQMTSWYSMKIGACFGYQRVIFDKFLIDMGIMFNLDMQLFGLEPNNNEMIGYSAPDLILAREMLRLKIGIGYLL